MAALAPHVTVDISEATMTQRPASAADQATSDAAAAASAAAQQAAAAADNADQADRDQLDVIDSGLGAYIGLASPTAAQNVTALKAVCRLCRYVIRRGRRQGWL